MVRRVFSVAKRMPYFIFRIFKRDNEKMLEYITEYGKFTDAKTAARKLRAEAGAAADHTVKIMFASAREEAETLLHEKRSAPILKEWEK